MKITKSVGSWVHDVTVDGDKYIRLSKDVWVMWMGESLEIEYDQDELEAAFQAFTADNSGDTSGANQASNEIPLP